MSERIGARERIGALARDFHEQDAGLVGGDPLAFEGYAEQLLRARSQTGLEEAAVWGWADLDGMQAALVAFDFSFMGGSMGVAVGEKVARAFDAARRRRAPVVTITASGGARMQEGMWSLVQMAKTVEARRRHAKAGLAHVTLLTSPTTGGVYASFATLADVVYAEEGATIGFAGPRVVQELTGETPASDMHTAAFALEHGLIDAIVGRDEQREVVVRTLRCLRPGTRKGAPAAKRHGATAASSSKRSAAERLALVRDPRRANSSDVMDVLLSDAVELHGDRTGASDDPNIIVKVGAMPKEGSNVVAIGQARGRIRPEGFRKATRAIELAGRLDLPVVTLIDTAGADPSADSEAHGIAAAIARTFEEMLDCPSPTLALILGEGGSGGALAMAAADRVVATENAVFSVIAPEAAAAILSRDPADAPSLAERLGITVPQLERLGLVDVVVSEGAEGIQKEQHAAVEALAETVASEVAKLAAERPNARLKKRRRRWRHAGGDLTRRSD